MDCESASHIFVSCRFARRCWDLIGNSTYQLASTFLDWLEYNFSNLADRDLCRVISICWKIWDARNEKTWNRVIISAEAVVHGATSFLHEWQTINSTTRRHAMNSNQDGNWVKPPTGWMKLNVDAALDTVNRKLGFGFVLRDEHGVFIAAKEIPKSGALKPDEAEVMGVKEALKWLKENHIDGVQIETDCMKITNNIKHQALSTYFDLLLNDVKEIAKSFSRLSFLFAKRSANKVAHLLAREALSKSDCENCLSVPFPSIVCALDMDLY